MSKPMNLLPQAPAAIKPVAQIQQPAQPPMAPPPQAVAQPSPMARPPVHATQRKVPSVQTGRGVVRTDTHNAANQLPASAKHSGRGL